MIMQGWLLSKGDAYGSFSLLFYAASCCFFAFDLLVVVVSKYVARRSIKASHSCKKGHGYFFQVSESLLASTSALTYTTFSWAVRLAAVSFPQPVHSPREDRTEASCKCVYLYHTDRMAIAREQQKDRGRARRHGTYLREPSAEYAVFFFKIHVEIMHGKWE
jgi:hypothetical protein